MNDEVKCPQCAGSTTLIGAITNRKGVHMSDSYRCDDEKDIGCEAFFEGPMLK